MKPFNASDLYTILEFISNSLDVKPRVKRIDVFSAVNGSLTTPRKEAEFLMLLSESIKNGRLGGLNITKGPMGGIVIGSFDGVKASLEILNLERQAEPNTERQAPPSTVSKVKEVVQKKEAKPEVVQKKEPKPYLSSQPKKTHGGGLYRWLWIRDSRYAVPLPVETIKTFLLRVMRAKEDFNGTIVFDGKKYSGDEQLLSRFLLDFVGAGLPSTSEPLLDTTDANGVPVSLIPEIHSNPSPETLADWNAKETNNNVNAAD